jgi:hypothetical protein
MLIFRHVSLALVAACLSLLSFASTAPASGPARITVRVEGLTQTLLPPTTVTTTTEPVVKDGIPEDSCPGTSALGALQLATSGNWTGPWDAEFKQYEIYSIEGESHPFGGGAYWDFWINHTESTLGACEAQLEAGDEVLLFPCEEGKECPSPLGIEAPASANVGEPVLVKIKKYTATGVASSASGVTVTGAATEATTDSGGNATLTFSEPGEYTVRATAPESVRTETTICVHAGNDGNCGTQAPSGSSTAQGSASGGVSAFSSAPYTGPFAIVAEATDLIDGHVYSRKHAPRVLGGSVLAHTTVTSVSLKLRREYRSRCYAYNGTREEFAVARCGQGSYFKVSTEPSFSYLLPSALAPGRYVLDIEATDAAGNHTTLARGSSRIVFYVG